MLLLNHGAIEDFHLENVSEYLVVIIEEQSKELDY